MGYLAALIIGYLAGCSSMAFYIGKLKKQDVRKAGTGNLGASNTAVLFGWGAGILVALHDIAKAVAAVLLTKWLFPDLEYAGAVAGVAAVMGHIFPFYLKFRGGKGLASFFGLTLALNWKLALMVAALILIITLVTDFIALGAMGSVIFVPSYIAITTHNWILVAILLVVTGVMIGKHWENVVRICNRTEIGLRSTAKGENRIHK